MKVTFVKQAGGALIPATDLESDKMTRFKNGLHYEIAIKQSRNQAFHGKVFAFLNFCYEHFDETTAYEFESSQAQFERFRKDLTILAGYHQTVTRIDGSQRIEAKSLSFANMDPDEFEQFYTAAINAACKHIFKDCSENTYNQLIGFF